MTSKNILVAVMMTGCLVACREQKKESSPANSRKYCIEKEFKDKIQIQTASLQPLTEGIHLMGSVEANPDKVVEYVSLVNGVVAYTHFSLGDRVVKGQVLAELHSAELSSLSAQGSGIDAQIKVAQRKLQSVKEMYDDGIASQKELLEAQSELDILRSDKGKISSDLSLYGANVGKGVFQVKAPVSGVITSKNLASGMQISGESGVLFTIASLEDVWVMANVYASNLQNVQHGMEVEISTLSYPGEIFRGKISMIPQVMDQEEKVLKARIAISNADMKLKPGMLVDVVVLKKQDRTAVAVPADAIVFADNENYVLVYKADCDVELRKVNILAKNDRTLFIESGLEAGEQIITQNQLLIYEQIKNFEN